jgi:hypothetical protein
MDSGTRIKSHAGIIRLVAMQTPGIAIRLEIKGSTSGKDSSFIPLKRRKSGRVT